MGNRFAAGKHAIAECDRCGQRYKLKELKKQVVKTNSDVATVISKEIGKWPSYGK